MCITIFENTASFPSLKTGFSVGYSLLVIGYSRFFWVSYKRETHTRDQGIDAYAEICYMSFSLANGEGV